MISSDVWQIDTEHIPVAWQLEFLPASSLSSQDKGMKGSNERNPIYSAEAVEVVLSVMEEPEDSDSVQDHDR